MSERLANIDLTLAQNVAKAVGGPVPTEGHKAYQGITSAGLSQTFYHPQQPTIASRRVAILIGDGFNGTQVADLLASLEAARAFPYIIGTSRSTIQAAGTARELDIQPHHHLEGFRSTMVDALFISGGAHIETLRASGRARHWVCEAFAHCKAIGAVGEAVGFVREAIAPVVDSVKMSKDGLVESYGVVTAGLLDPASAMPKDGKITADAKDFVGKFFYSISLHRVYGRETDGLAAKLAY